MSLTSSSPRLRPPLVLAEQMTPGRLEGPTGGTDLGMDASAIRLGPGCGNDD